MERTSWKAFSPGYFGDDPLYRADRVLDNIVGIYNRNLFIATTEGGRKFQYLQIDFGVSKVRPTSLNL